MRLFARDIKGGIKEWNIILIEDTNSAIIKAGRLNGNLIETIIEHLKIESEIASRIAKKRKEGYVSLKDLGLDYISTGLYGNDLPDILNKHLPKYNTDANSNLKPMKCQKFKENTIKYPAIVQPKLNGLRCVLRWETYTEGEGMFAENKEHAVLRGKEGHEYVLPHITNNFKKTDFYLNERELVYDGELYAHKIPLNIIKSSCPMYNSNRTLSKPSGNPRIISFYIFDLSIPDVIQEDRLDMILQKNIFYFNINIIPRYYINDDEEARRYRDEFISMGYEGCVIRETGTEYAFGFRPKFIRKYKDYIDSEFLIVGVTAKPSDNTLPILVLKNDINDSTFESVLMGDYDYQRSIMENINNYIGMYATVRYRERTGTVDKIPFHTNVLQRPFISDIRTTKNER